MGDRRSSNREAQKRARDVFQFISELGPEASKGWRKRLGYSEGRRVTVHNRMSELSDARRRMTDKSYWLERAKKGKIKPIRGGKK